MKSMINNQRAAVITIGSNKLRLLIAQKKKDNLEILEKAEYPIQIGQDAFTAGYVSFDHVDIISRVIDGYTRLIDEYQVSLPLIRAVATSAMREAGNRDYILDQIKIKTGISVQVIEDIVEKEFIYQEIIRTSAVKLDFEETTNAIAYIGTGSLGVAVCKAGILQKSRSFSIGSTKITEMLRDAQDCSLKFYYMVEEYLNTFRNSVKMLLEAEHIAQIITAGKEIELIASLITKQNYGDYLTISSQDFTSLYDEIKNLTPLQIEKAYKLTDDQANSILPSMALYNLLFDISKCSHIIATKVTLEHALIYQILYAKEYQKIKMQFLEHTLTIARNLGEYYHYDRLHSQCVESYALLFFDKLKSIHAMRHEDRKLLQIAAILHDTGKLISAQNHQQHSFYIAYHADLPGLSTTNKLIMALTAQSHSDYVPTLTNPYFSELSEIDRVRVAKLSSILRLADALDRSHMQKFERLRIALKKDTLLVTGISHHNVLLEDWTFQRKSLFLTEVFGIRAIFTHKVIQNE